MINFTGHHIFKSKIKRNLGNISKDEKVNFVKIDTSSLNDIKTLETVNNLWEQETTLTHKIYKEAKNCYKDLLAGETEFAEQFFILTKQNKNYENLIPDDILGITLVTELKNSGADITFIQVSPESLHGCFERQFFKVGSALISALKKYYKDCYITVTSLKSTIPFYKKNKFIQIGENRFLFLSNKKEAEKTLDL